MPRLIVALIASLAIAAPVVAQTVRFETSVGAFDMLLNPTNNANLQAHVDNLLANVAAGVYHRAVVNRAAEDFVLQIGSFQTESVSVAEIPEFGFAATNAFDPVVVDADNDGDVDFSTAGLTNRRGTVSLALAAGNANSGSASFFVNLTNNSFLDAQDFIPFATISDMATIDRIMNQPIVDLSAAVGQNGSLAYIDVPLADDGDLIVIESATVVSGDNQVFVGPLRRAFGFDASGLGATDPNAGVIPDVMDPVDGGSGPGGFDNPFAGIPDDVLTSLPPETIQALLNGDITAAELLGAIDSDFGGMSFGQSAPVSAIPEPTAFGLVALAGLAAWRRR